VAERTRQTEQSGPRVEDGRGGGANAIYERPGDYDLEHEGNDEDVRFYIDLVARLRPRRVLELAAGSGRVTLPLARSVGDGVEIVGLELSDTMLGEAERKKASLPADEQRRVAFVGGDLRDWAADQPFDLIVTPCSSLTHLLSLDDQLAAWTRAHDNLAPGGRFVVDLVMPNLAAYTDSMLTPPRTLVEIDSDTRDPETGERLLRSRTTRYVAHEQRAEIRFIYDKLVDNTSVDRYVMDFDSHVYYPREVELLFRLTGFDVEHRFGDYRMGSLRRKSRVMIVVGVRR
jgi:SAM-dependent methyltransferase